MKTPEEHLDLIKKQNYMVVKSNQLIQKSRYELSVPEQRAIAYICSMIKPRTAFDKIKNSPFELEYQFNIKDYAEICGINDNGRVYEETKSLLRSLTQKVYWITLEDGSETTVNWVNKVWTNKRSGKARVRIDEDMALYLFDLQEKFTEYGLINILKMKSQYSIRLYELFQSYEWQKNKTFDIDELKHLLMVENVKSYVDFGKFRKKVLEVALNEINQFTNLHVSMETETKGRKVVKVKFLIKDVFKSASKNRQTLFDNEKNGRKNENDKF